MGVLETTEELNVSANRVWRASRDADNLMPKLVPDIFSSQEKLHGDGGVGTIRQITLGEGTNYAPPTLAIYDLKSNDFISLSHTKTYRKDRVSR